MTVSAIGKAKNLKEETEVGQHVVRLENDADVFVWLPSDSSFNLRDKSNEARSKQNAYCPVVSQDSHKS